MNITPPPGSRIRIEENDTGEPTIVMPVPLNVLRTLFGIFVVIWLVAWVFGEQRGISGLLSSMTNVFALAFSVLWLTFWTLAGILAVYLLYRALRPTAPESLHLKSSGVGYDGGAHMLQFSERCRCEISFQQMQSLRLRDAKDDRGGTSYVSGGRCLTVDVEGRQIEIGAFARPAEIEWLALLLADRYGVPYERVGC